MPVPGLSLLGRIRGFVSILSSIVPTIIIIIKINEVLPLVNFNYCKKSSYSSDVADTGQETAKVHSFNHAMM